jgi:integrase/recombinase XerD
VRLVASELSRLFGALPARQFTVIHVAALVGRWRNEYAKNTQHVRIKALRRILREVGPLIGNPEMHHAVPRMAQPKASQKTVSHLHRERLLAACPAWLRLFVLLCADLALRFSASLRAAPADYNPESGLLTVVLKGGETQTLPVTEEIRGIFAAAPKDRPPEMPYIEALAGKPRTKEGIRYCWRVICKKLGLPADVQPHSFRRTAASNLYELTKDPRLVQQLLGHKSMHSTVRYIVDRDPKNLRPLLETMKLPTNLTQ